MSVILTANLFGRQYNRPFDDQTYGILSRSRMFRQPAQSGNATLFSPLKDAGIWRSKRNAAELSAAASFIERERV